MADTTAITPKTSARKVVEEGGISGGLSYFLLTASTEWLGYLPDIPEGHFLTMVVAGTAIFSGIGRGIAWLYRQRG